jgi:lysozyme family protein
MADFEKAVQVILKHEGGFVNHPSDPGGATNRGITFSVFKQYAKALGLTQTVEALKGLTEDQAKFIYHEHFWNPMKGGEIIDQQVATIIFDAFVNQGYRGLKMAQREAGAHGDGKIGPKSLQAINAAAPRLLFDGIKDARRQYYINLVDSKPAMHVFLNGWLNRVNSFTWKA